MGFYVRAMCESLVKNLWRSGFPDLPCHYWPAKWVTWKAHAGIWRVIDRLVFMSDLWLRPSREWPAKPTACCILECAFLILYQHYINPYYPWNVRRRSFFEENFERETLTKHLRVRDCFTHDPLHHFSKVSIYSHLSTYASMRGS